MDFEWDEAKNAANVRKHGIDFADAMTIFEAWTLTAIDDRLDYGEVRSVSIGPMANLLIATVIHTDRSNRIRLISARPASTKERQRYETALQAASDGRGTQQSD